ncbi:MAG: CPBP family glutamic-type intramembrane protease [Eubacteriales bacterium]|nr:CPBP family glutamic-type intramembrane protease [Eubacteriales bacterium]
MEKEKKIIPFGSHEYSLLRGVLFLLVAFLGGQILGAVPALLIRLIPSFRAGGYFHSIYESTYLLLVFFFNFLILVWLLKKMLKTNVKQIISNGQPWKKKYVAGCVIIYLLLLVPSIIRIFTSDIITYQPAELKLRLVSVVICLLLIPFQTTVEELLFRCVIGRYFFRNRFPAPLWKVFLVSVLSGLIFFAPHLANPEVGAYGYGMAVVQYFFTGFSLMAIDLLVGSYEASVVIHALNNLISALLFTGEVSSLSFPALFVDHSTDVTKDNILLVAVYCLMILWAFVYRKKAGFAAAAEENAPEESETLS